MFTVSVWFNPYDLADGQQMLAGKNRYSRNERQWSLTVEPDGKLKAHLRQNGRTAGIRFRTVANAVEAELSK